MQSPLSGIFPPIVTPLRDRDTLDVAGLEKLLEHVIAGGVHGIFALGTSAETAHLSTKLRYELITHVCRHVNGRVPVLVVITDTSIVDSLNLARHAAESGAAFIVSSAPYYFALPQDELITRMLTLANEAPLPLLLYNMPQMTKVSFAPETVRVLAENEKIIGIKDSSGDLPYFELLLKATAGRKSFSCLVGPENLLIPTMRRGGRGGVNGGANIFPLMFVRLYNALAANDAREVEALQRGVELLAGIYAVAAPHSAGFIKGMKSALSLLGICDERMAEPMTSCTNEARLRIKKILEALDTR